LDERIKQAENSAAMAEIYVEKWLTFTLIDGRWNIQLWAIVPSR
jgi:hypothetical protein